MSRGPGIIQSRIIEEFEANPDLEMTADDAVSLLYPHDVPKQHCFAAAARALRTLMPRLGLTRSKVYRRSRAFYVYRKAR